MPKSYISTVITLFLFLSSITAFAQIEEQVSVGIMEIWVKVTDKQDRPVTDLAADDFEVFIDQQKMNLRCFDKAFASVQKGETKSTPLKRKFILFFDLLNSSPGDVNYLKQSIVSFLKTGFDRDDQAMVFTLLPNYRLGVVQNMTSDSAALISVVQKMRGNATLAFNLRNNEQQLLDVLYEFDTTQELQAAPNSPGPRTNESIRNARSLARSFASQEEMRAKHTLDSFLGIAEYLSNHQQQGRLVMMYISGGFPLHPGQVYFDLIEQAIEERRATGSNDLAFREHPTGDFLSEVKEATGTLNRLNVTIYSIDTKGLLNRNRSADRSNQQLAHGMNTLQNAQDLQDSLNVMARETGGTAFLNSQNYDEHLGRIVQDMNEQYWLCTDLPQTNSKGYHKIEVKVKRPGVSVRHRKGFMN